MGKYAGMSVVEVLRLKKGSIRTAPLPPNSPSWEDLSKLTWEEIDAGARQNKPGFKMVRKLLSDQRFDR
jgi:hypothetical protein